MKTITPSVEEMEARLARFGDLKPYGKDFADSIGVPEAVFKQLTADKVYTIMTPANYQGRSKNAPVKGVAGAVVNIAECPPKNGPGLHVHEQTVENFFCLSGSFDIIWGDDEEHSLTLEPLDFISIPPGVARRFYNKSDEIGRLLVIIQPVNEEQKDRVAYAPRVADDMASTFGPAIIEKLETIGFHFDAGQE
ncbi:Mannose-6-phosphate isomerase, cupin superfamily [Tistlia consotensis]|uniref:Mannose-6-phosphate isomerase, cupin superfamily n=1 Tax=Tistlia consotensis USBA 355 TaxID=560819 RepID=A0A1Y6BZY5_9PROT|nr:cupin domain-containing protein [Tistlia consotensis]SMF36948.1 Mannose-6-phosphate isomerase, cupin superfamily [Tistlia consotensis USBA 355]SNR72382.1 Mannose-6-phosphate isomerase, cupin superfamily [Tistlia consotensis]